MHGCKLLGREGFRPYADFYAEAFEDPVKTLAKVRIPGLNIVFHRFPTGGKGSADKTRELHSRIGGDRIGSGHH